MIEDDVRAVLFDAIRPDDVYRPVGTVVSETNENWSTLWPDRDFPLEIAGGVLDALVSEDAIQVRVGRFDGVPSVKRKPATDLRRA